MNIIITESQLDVFRLLEAGKSNIIIGDDDIKDNSNNISTSALVTDENGEEKPGKDVATDEISKGLANQNGVWVGLRYRSI